MMNRRYVVVMVFALLLSTAFSTRVLAYPFVDGQVITHVQGDWGDANLAGVLLAAQYETVYASSLGVLELGLHGTAGYSILLDGAGAAQVFLPQGGAPGPLVADLLNPSSTAAGAFGGEVAALHLNVDFSDAGVMLGTLGIPFGDLVLTNFTDLTLLNGLTVREYTGVVDTLLGGGSGIYSISELSPFTETLNLSFGNGIVDQFALDHLTIADEPPSQVPEPATLLLLGSGLAGLVALRRKL